MEILIVLVSLCYHLGEDIVVLLGYLVKADCLHCLALRGDQLLPHGRKGDNKTLQLKT